VLERAREAGTAVERAQADVEAAAARRREAIVELHDVHRLSYARIAAELGIHPQTVYDIARKPPRAQSQR